jgi:hypothetical protein
MVIINKPEMILEDEDVIIRSMYEYKNCKDYLWYKIPMKYKDYVVTENLDAFFIGMLLFAMKNGENIELRGPVSEKLYYSVKKYLICALSLSFNELKEIDIIAKNLNSQNLNIESSAATAVSCGVDSFSTIFEYLNVEEQFKIKYFTFFNAGSHGENGGKMARKVYRDRLNIVKPYADERNIDVITVDTNNNEILEMDHEVTHMFRNIACVLNLQKLFKYYYHSSSFRLDFFINAAEYDLSVGFLLSTESINFYTTGAQYTRVEKTEMIINYEPTYRYLNVCIGSSTTGKVQNCSSCAKCLRTQITLDVLGKLHLYHRVFDIEDYKRNKNKHIGRIFANIDGGGNYMFVDEIRDFMKKRGYKIPLGVYYYKYKILFILGLKKVVRIILGKNIYTFIKRRVKNVPIEEC